MERARLARVLRAEVLFVVVRWMKGSRMTSMHLATLNARLAFAAAERQARIGWRLGRVPVFDARSPTGPFVTLVGFLPSVLAGELARTVSALPALEGHFCYSPAQLHVTVRNLDGARLSGVSALIDDLAPLSFVAGRLSFTPSTLLLQSQPVGMALRGLRERLDGVASRPRGRLGVGSFAFANVVRLSQPVAAELRRSVAKKRHEFVGRRFELDELVLVRTDKVGSPEHTEVLQRYPLGSGR